MIVRALTGPVLRAPGVRLALVVALATAVATLFVHDAEAHAVLIRSVPENGATEQQAPFRAVLYFSEPVEPRLTEIEVTDADGARVDKDDLEVDPDDRTVASVGLEDLDPGLYTVSFGNVSSVDGHPWNGQYQFIILNDDGTIPADAVFDPTIGQEGGTGGLLPRRVDAALRWVALLSLATIAGAAFWLLAVARPAASFLEEDAYRAANEAAESWLARITHILLPLAFVATAVLIAITVNRFDRSTSLTTYLTSIRTGQYRLALEVLTIVALAAGDMFYVARAKPLRDVALMVLLGTTAGGLLTYSLTSHGAAGDGAFWATTSDYVHLLATAAWLGALVMVGAFLWWSRRSLEPPARFLYMANLFDRFSIVAGLSVVAILATGAFNGFAQLPNAGAMVDTTYGRVLLVKLVIMAPLLAVAGLNAFVLKPRLVAAIDLAYQPRDDAVPEARERAEERLVRLRRLLPRTIALEIALVVAVVASVAVLTQTSTAKGEIAQEEARAKSGAGFRDRRVEGRLDLELRIAPNRVGINEYELSVLNPDGTAASGVTQARLRFSYIDPGAPQGATGQAELILRPAGSGVYAGQGSYFTQPGSWRVEAGIRREGADDVARSFVVSVAAAEAKASARQGGRFDLPFTVFGWNYVLGALLALMGGAIVVYRRQLDWLERTAYRTVMSAAAALMIAAAVLIFGVHTHQPVTDASAGNPVKPTEESVARGRELFQQNCASCHGVDGRGDGPAAAALNPAPVDLRQHLPFHNDPQFYAFISGGLPGTAMTAWKGQLSEEDIWNLVNFLRASFSEVPTQ